MQRIILARIIFHSFLRNMQNFDLGLVLKKNAHLFRRTGSSRKLKYLQPNHKMDA